MQRFTDQGQRAPSPRPNHTTASPSPSRRSPRPTLPSLPAVPPPSSLMHQVAPTPTSPYSSMTVPTRSYFEQREMDDYYKLAQRNFASLADSVGFDSVVLKQRESDRVTLGKIKSAEQPNRQASPAAKT
ncbi:hypothetical protein BMF94_0076 [Rhodotorula taiwanensis]|uniref:Uncharacterized protein n=1 Tax=Rhodotorula taiwanensis TaxID=741276 RepID=A0A2S5BJ71_9BASI|nr:hypothetical protein BMF94_0076 [Rhodotorula taiwanensis]